MKLDAKYLPSLSRIFTPVVMDSLALKGHSGYLTEICANSGLLDQIDLSMPLSQFFDWIYNILFKNYRNEYIYKNVIANKILLGRYSLNTSHMLTELRVGKCKADAVIMNGTSAVYEIKSEFDSFARLESQIKTYFQAFDHINVITSSAQAKKVESMLPKTVGILVLTDRNSISTIRKSISNKRNTKPGVMFDSLKKNEYLKTVKEYYGKVPNVPNTLIHRECKSLFCEIPPIKAHDLMVNTLRKRNNSKLLKDVMTKLPPSLSAYALSIRGEKAKMLALMSNFTSNIGSVIIPRLA